MAPTPTRVLYAFWLLGLLNNTAYVIMIAGAKDILPSAVGLVYVCNVLPGFAIKLTGPYWFHYVRYKHRVYCASLLMGLSFLIVALGQITKNAALSLFGILFCSAQGSLGEASFVALSAFYDSRKALTAWSSGTGFAGVFGYLWVSFFTLFLGLNFETSLLLALSLAAGFVAVYIFVLPEPEVQRECTVPPPEEALRLEPAMTDADDDHAADGGPAWDGPGDPTGGPGALSRTQEMSKVTSSMTVQQRVAVTATLWPYMIPLTVVYFAEYAMQTGTWAAIGFPVTDAQSRKLFYTLANWMYQWGVFVSRSSGMLVEPTRLRLWVMPTLQTCLLVLFCLTARYQLWYDWTLLAPCFVVGLLGGAVYVGALSLIAIEVPEQHREFALSAACLADTVGIIFSDIVGVGIQRWLYGVYDIHD
uniref:Battenin n=1 Tax=Eutreptiella gymnastica TaxID=73025 RepID=A0A7S1JHF2_9EUGL